MINYINNIPIEETLRNHIDIYDFCISQRTGWQFINELHTIKNGKLNIEKLQKNIRYYVSNSGGTLLKKYKDEDKRISLLAGERATIFNNYINKSMTDYDIRYNYYRKECYKIINLISNSITSNIKGTKSKSGISGNLFDNLNN